MKRIEAESELDFTGFIIFENKLKSTTADVLQELETAGIRKVMCTGDNILTAISVARECHLIDKTAHCFVPHFIEGLLPPWISEAVPRLICSSRRFARSKGQIELGEHRQQHIPT